MGILPSPVEKAQRRLTDIRAELSAARARLKPDLDFDEGFATREQIAVLERKEAAAVDALAYAEELQAKAVADAAKAEATAELERYGREAKREVPSRLNKIAKLQEALAPELDWLKAHVERAADMNGLAQRFGLPGVVDGETLHRKTPDRTIPAQFEEREVWRDSAGNQPSQYRQHPDTGEMVPLGGGTKRREKVQISGERTVFGQIPGGRLCDNIRLMNLKGEPLFSAR
jgi:hypothetical protein